MSPFVNLILVAEHSLGLGTARIGLHHCGHRTGVVLTGHLQQCLSHRTWAVLSSVRALCASACNCWALLQSYDCSGAVLCGKCLSTAPPPESSFKCRYILSIQVLLWVCLNFCINLCTNNFVRKMKATIINLFSVYFFVNFNWVCLRAAKV